MVAFAGPTTVHLYVNGPTPEAILALIRTAIRDELNPLEALMTAESDAITALDAKVTDLIADVRAALAAISADPGTLGPDGQAALDTLTAKVDAFDVEVGDADGSDTTP
jgi:hypothetical protein